MPKEVDFKNADWLKDFIYIILDANQTGVEMSNGFGTGRLAALLTLFSLSALNPGLWASDCCEPMGCNRFYIGAFGGGIYSNSSRVTQAGTVFYGEEAGGPQAVRARGNTRTSSAGFGGLQFGYEGSASPFSLGCAGWAIAPAGEVEGYWYKHTQSGQLVNETNRPTEREFQDSFTLHTAVYLANAVFSLNNNPFGAYSPYIGGGIGAARISIRNATSVQTADTPIIEDHHDHFNSRPNCSTWAFAAQFKAGVRYNLCHAFHLFGEYRYLYIDYSNYTFGATEFSDHPPTSRWNVRFKNIQSNAFVFGIQYDL